MEMGKEQQAQCREAYEKWHKENYAFLEEPYSGDSYTAWQAAWSAAQAGRVDVGVFVDVAEGGILVLVIVGVFGVGELVSGINLVVAANP